MRAKFSPLVQKQIIRIRQKDRKLAEKIEKQITLFEKDPKHPSLRTHKLSSNINNMWSISITMSIRMIYILVEKDRALFVKIGTHDQVYRK